MKWVTRERTKVDRIACPWLIKKFVDPEAEFLFVPAERVKEVARLEGDDFENTKLQFPAYDALYEYCRSKLSGPIGLENVAK